MFIIGRELCTHLSFPLCQTFKKSYLVDLFSYMWYMMCVWERGCLALYSKPVPSSFLNLFLGIEISLKPSTIEKWNRLLKDWMMHFKLNRHVDYLLFSCPSWSSLHYHCTLQFLHGNWRVDVKYKLCTSRVKRNEDFFFPNLTTHIFSWRKKHY